MQVRLIQNVLIDGVVQNAGTIIDTSDFGVSAESLIGWHWAEPLQARRASKGQATSDAPDETTSDPAPPLSYKPNKQPAPKPRKK